jgi:aminobenzoyl-glutamate utilization protein B
MKQSQVLPRSVAFAAALFSLLQVPHASGQAASAAHQQVEQDVTAHGAEYKDASRKIWEYAELGYHEQKSSALLQQDLKAAGFQVQSGVADEPTGFIASFGSGKPVIAILGEFDALPGLSQDSEPDRKPIANGAPGHGCGHNLLGSGAALAAVAVKDYMVQNHTAGTLRFYGTPAEEGGSGKVYMLRAGLFKDVDVVLHWHPEDRNSVVNGGMLAITSARFTFHGIAAHAAAAPERGRSALDAVMLMGNGIEFMREHVPSNTRMHYIITKGGAAANIVPDLAEMSLVARNPSQQTLNEIWARLLKVAQGAALMTETTVDIKIESSSSNILANNALAAIAQKNLEEVGGFTYTDKQKEFALALQKSLPPGGALSLDMTKSVVPLPQSEATPLSASTDVSWSVPTIGFLAATFVPGVVPHTWQAAATAGMSIGQDGMMVASRALAITAVDLFTDPALVQAAKADFQKKLTGKSYESAIPLNQKPEINYRDN